MIEEGVLDAAGEPVAAAYAVHVDSTTPGGRWVTRSGPIMAGVSALRIEVVGTGGHAAHPHQSVDPVPVAAQIILGVQAFTARRIPVSDPAVISLTRLGSDSAAGNVLARSVSMDANIRTLAPATRDLVRAELPALVAALGQAHGCTVRTEWVDSYPVTVNDPAETERAVEVLQASGPDRVSLMPFPATSSEDFAYVLAEVPGTLVFLGVRPADGVSGPMHSDTAVFDDSWLVEQAGALVRLARRRLAS